MSDVEDELLADLDAAPAAPRIGDNSLRAVSDLAGALVEMDARIALLEADLKQAKDDRRRLAQEILPEAMAAVGLSSFRLADGSAVEIEALVKVGISRERAPAAHDWLRQHGHGDLIKTVVTASYGRGDEALAQAAAAFVAAQKAKVERKEAVHPQTLGKWAREMLESGREFPAGLFGLFTGREATISKRK